MGVPRLHLDLGRREQRHPEVHLPAGTVHHHRDADRNATSLANGIEGLSHGTARGEHIVDYEGPLAGLQVEVASDGAPSVVALRDHTPKPEVARYLVSDDHAAGRRADDELRFEALPALGEAAAHDLGLRRPLEQVEFLEVGVGVTA